MTMPTDVIYLKDRQIGGLESRISALESERDELKAKVDEWEKRIREWQDDNLRQARLIVEQRDIIYKLPKTADGVSVVPGMKLYSPEIGECKFESIVDESSYMYKAVGDPRGTWSQYCYSTPEAAQAAQEKTK